MSGGWIAATISVEPGDCGLSSTISALALHRSLDEKPTCRLSMKPRHEGLSRAVRAGLGAVGGHAGAVFPPETEVRGERGSASERYRIDAKGLSGRPLRISGGHRAAGTSGLAPLSAPTEAERGHCRAARDAEGTSLARVSSLEVRSADAGGVIRRARRADRAAASALLSGTCLRQQRRGTPDTVENWRRRSDHSLPLAARRGTRR